LKDKVLTFPDLCHGCGGCSLLCPKKAISESGKEIGVIEKGHAGEVAFVHGKLNVGEILSPPVIRAVKNLRDPHTITIIDAPPGTACPVIAAIKDSDFCVLVTEPTPFGLHDLQLAVEVVQKLGIQSGVVINRSDLGDDAVAEYCNAKGIPVLMHIPFDRDIAVAYSRGIPFIQRIPGYQDQFKQMYEQIRKSIHAR
jgi:MinD superfamily P-loop ATPase